MTNSMLALLHLLPEQCDLLIETSWDVIHAHPYFVSMTLIATCLAADILNDRCILGIATNPFGCRLDAVVILQRYGRDNDQATS